MKRLLYIFLWLGWSSIVFAQANTTQNIEAIVQMGHSKTITANDISEDGKYLATGSIDRSIIIWEVKTGKEIRILHHHVKSIIALHFSPDGQHILSASNDQTVKLTNVKTGEVVHTLKHEKYDIANAYFNGNGQKIIILDKRQHFSIWDVATGQLEGYFKKDYGAYNDQQTISFNGEKVLTKLRYNRVGCVSLITGDTLFTMPFDKAYTLNFSPDGQYIVIGSSKLFATVFDAETGDSLHTVRTDEKLKCDGCKTRVRISDDSKSVYTMSNKETGLLWHIKSGKIIQRFKTPKKSPDNFLLTTDHKHLMLSFDKLLILYDVNSGREIFRQENKDLDGFEIKLKSGQFILPGPNQSVDLWSLSRQKVIKNFKGFLNQERSDGLGFDYSNWVDVNILQYISFKTSLDVHPNSREIVFGKIDSSAIVLDLKTGRVNHKITGARKANLCQAYSKDGNRLAVAGGDRKIRIYDTETYDLIRILSGHQELIFDVQFSNDPNILVSGSWDGTMRTWNIEREEMLSYIELDKNSPYIVRYSPKDLYILSGDLTENIDFWEADTRHQFRRLIGHSEPISDIVFSDDGQQVLTASWDGKIKLWHTLTGMQLAKFNDKGAPIYAVNFFKRPTTNYFRRW